MSDSNGVGGSNYFIIKGFKILTGVDTLRDISSVTIFMWLNPLFVGGSKGPLLLF